MNEAELELKVGSERAARLLEKNRRLAEMARSYEKTPSGRRDRQRLLDALAGKNAMLQYARDAEPYILPGEYNAGGWANAVPPYDSYIAIDSAGDDRGIADVVAHEGLHRRRFMAGEDTKKAGGGSLLGNADGYTRDQFGHPDYRLLRDLREIISRQNNYRVPLNYNADAEETLATIAGMEGQMPAGLPLTAVDDFKEIANRQRLKNYVFQETSVPYGGIWEGQAPRGASDVLRDLYRDLQGYKQSAARNALTALTMPFDAIRSLFAR